MTTIIKIAATITLTLMMLSCQMVSNIGPGVRGNGNVQTEVRQAASFNKIEVSNGLDLFLTQGTEESISIQADENLLEVIKTEVNGGILRNICRRKHPQRSVSQGNGYLQEFRCFNSL